MSNDFLKQEKGFSILIFFAFVIIVVSLIAITVYNKEEDTDEHPTYTVKQGPLKISVSTYGGIQAREKITIKSKLEGKKGATVLSLIDEGVKVKKGDLLIELDASSLIEKKLDQELKVQDREANFISGRENLAVVKNQAQSNIQKAQITYDFAVQDLQKYLDGEYPNQLKEAEANIVLKQEEATRAEDELKWSKKLYEDKYISESKLEADEFSLKKKLLDLEMAQNNLELLKNFTHKMKLAQLESDVHQTQMALDRTRLKAGADIIKTQSNLKARELRLIRQKSRLVKYEEQIKMAKIYAPADGTVIYSSSAAMSGGFGKGGGGGRGRSSTEPLAEGSSVRERQDLFQLPTGAGMDAVVGIYETSLDKVSRVGLPVEISIEMLPGEVFTGRVKSIGLLPDARSAYTNPDNKIYKAVINVDNTPNISLLRTGMNCTAEIIVEHHKETTYIPIQAVLFVDGKHTVYVEKDGLLEPRKVEIGMDNNSLVVIKSGLEAGEIVSLVPPLDSAAVKITRLDIPDENAS
ncbi:MAG: efflux transporter periplasmic adaptor subunit [Deltaproteobacteria bacterium]|nr:efflux transporter periplasmic adaptor subunit [Deltaproteobacteria bacterium]